MGAKDDGNIVGLGRTIRPKSGFSSLQKQVSRAKFMH
jgi:hypothetical protein